MWIFFGFFYFVVLPTVVPDDVIDGGYLLSWKLYEG
jgi:hypothetical protein